MPQKTQTGQPLRPASEYPRGSAIRQLADQLLAAPHGAAELETSHGTDMETPFDWEGSLYDAPDGRSFLCIQQLPDPHPIKLSWRIYHRTGTPAAGRRQTTAA